MYKWAISTEKGVQHHQSSGKCKSKPQEISSPTSQNGYDLKKKKKCWQGCGEIENLLSIYPH